MLHTIKTNKDWFFKPFLVSYEGSERIVLERMLGAIFCTVQQRFFIIPYKFLRSSSEHNAMIRTSGTTKDTVESLCFLSVLLGTEMTKRGWGFAPSLPSVLFQIFKIYTLYTMCKVFYLFFYIFSSYRAEGSAIRLPLATRCMLSY